MRSVKYYRQNRLSNLWSPIQAVLTYRDQLFRSDNDYHYYDYFANIRNPTL